MYAREAIFGRAREDLSTAAQSDFIRQIPLTTKDLVYDKNSQMLYASVPSSAGADGNSITPINPAMGEVGTSVFIGSEPNKLALSDDGRTLYTNLSGANAVLTSAEYQTGSVPQSHAQTESVRNSMVIW